MNNSIITAEIKDAVWELKTAKKTITVKNVYDQANGKIPFEELPKILQFLESIKESYNWTTNKGYLELNVREKITIDQYISRA